VPPLEILSIADSSAMHSRVSTRSKMPVVFASVGSQFRFICATSVVMATLITVWPGGRVFAVAPTTENATPGASSIVSMDNSTGWSTLEPLTMRTSCVNDCEPTGSTSNVTEVLPSASLLYALIVDRAACATSTRPARPCFAVVVGFR